jgi:uncharacterized protein (DUF1501 family)
MSSDQDRTRRAFLRAGGAAALGLTMGGPLTLGSARGSSPTGPGAPTRAVIVLWLWGGPSQLDTFDPKPDAPIEYRGPFESIATSVPGVRFVELLPGLARRAHRLAVIRSLRHESNDHGVAGTIALTGSIAGAVDLGGNAATGAMKPSVGAIVSRLSRDRERASVLPPYVVLGSPLHQGLKRVVGEGGGLLGGSYDPFRLDYEPGRGVKVPDLDLPPEVTADRMQARWDLHRELTSGSPLGTGRAPRDLDRQYALARSLLESRSGLDALDLEAEPERVRARYGSHRFGRCCLIARRLVEAGTPFVQVNWSTHVECPEDAGDGGWDMHDRYFAIMQDRHGWMLDRAMSALLDDLADRGLLDSTLVVAVGEFGRTPKINEKAGRDHWNHCYSAVLAGGGVPGGVVIGASDRRAEHPTDQPVSPADLGATILARMGVGAADLTGIGLVPMGEPIAGLA